MRREELIAKTEEISVRLSELYTKEQNEGLTKDDKEDLGVLVEWLEELTHVEVEN